MQEQEQLRWEGTGEMSQEEQPETGQHTRRGGDLGSMLRHRKKECQSQCLACLL